MERIKGAACYRAQSNGFLKFAYSYKPNADKKEIVKQLKRLGFKYNKDMRGFGTKMDRNNDEIYIKGGFVGFKERKDEETDSELN